MSPTVILFADGFFSPRWDQGTIPAASRYVKNIISSEQLYTVPERYRIHTFHILHLQHAKQRFPEHTSSVEHVHSDPHKRVLCHTWSIQER